MTSLDDRLALLHQASAEATRTHEEARRKEALRLKALDAAVRALKAEARAGRLSSDRIYDLYWHGEDLTPQHLADVLGVPVNRVRHEIGALLVSIDCRLCGSGVAVVQATSRAARKEERYIGDGLCDECLADLS
jgi:ElaB/YqjD/DUF883 family membrane-anchored ribosome-binding protein